MNGKSSKNFDIRFLLDFYALSNLSNHKKYTSIFWKCIDAAQRLRSMYNLDASAYKIPKIRTTLNGFKLAY